MSGQQIYVYVCGRWRTGKLGSWEADGLGCGGFEQGTATSSSEVKGGTVDTSAWTMIPYNSR